jgi:hypothetical protein
MEFRFVISDAGLHDRRPGNNTVILLWIGCALLWTTLDEILGSTYLPPTSTARPAILKRIDSIAEGGRAVHGSVLVLKEIKGNDLDLIWLFQPMARPCRQWAQERLIGEIDQRNIGNALLSKLQAEIAKGADGLALEWASHYDSITPGY